MRVVVVKSTLTSFTTSFVPAKKNLFVNLAITKVSVAPKVVIIFTVPTVGFKMRVP